ncbi:hypothetical protein [Inquilinus limosus]|uniref:Uncharacterized protein n=1 Tax=Inquilinus limosus MP06 TaxID=1398085 RepID=A0A0A0D2E3_9PROT|nr:hypothetical protein [Inquilinus limosus]KGM32229.1 hypothetical protein P409_22645 [Inquilinus limosus MP06]
MPTTLRVIAIIEFVLSAFVTLWCWFGDPRSFFLGLIFLFSGFVSAAVFVALARVLENSELMRAELGLLRDDLWRELKTLRDGGGPAPSRSPSPPPPRPSTAPIRESTDPVTRRVTYVYNGVSYDSRLAAVAQLAEDERRGQKRPAD